MSTSTEKITTSSPLNLISNNLPELRIIDDEDDFHALEDEWGALVESGEFTIYQTFEWNKSWWKYFGAGKKLHIILMYDDDGSLITIVPFFRDSVCVAKNDVYACLRFLGSSVSQPKGPNLLGLHPYSDYLDFIIKPGYEEIAYAMLIQYLRRDEVAYHEIILDEIPEESTVWKYLIPELESKNYDFKIENSSVCPIIKLGGSWDDYQNSLSKKQRYNNNRALRMVDEDSKKGFHVKEVQNVDELNETFDLLVDLHQKRWNQMGFPGAFGEIRMYNFMKEVVTDFFEKGWVQLRTAESVREKGRVIAVDLLFEYRNRTYLVHRALNSDSHYSKYGPGNVLLSVAIKSATEKNMDYLDFLRGEEQFKFRTANTTAINKCITIAGTHQNSTVAVITRKYVAAKRRLELEWIQFNLFLKGETFNPGLAGFFKFLHMRLKAKLAARAKE